MKKSAVSGSNLAALLLILVTLPLCAASAWSQVASTPAPLPATMATSTYTQGAWEFGPVIQGGVGTGNRSSFSFFSAGVHVGNVLSRPALPGILRGQFELAGEFFPLWQSYTPAPHLQPIHTVSDGIPETLYVPYGGGTFSGITLTPIILRWNFETKGKLVPWVQGAGGLLWTNHKYPPDYYAPYGGTSVWNFTPQFGVGFNYFIKPKRSISFAANAVHISSASLGDHNPGVNASVQFELGYSWWK